MKAIIAKHHARIGRRGGSVSSEAKRLAARRNALLRWGRKPEEAVIPMDELKDGQWYRGIGRNSNIGRWDKETRCFWVVSFANFPDPERYPKGSTRIVRLKQEGYYAPEGGTFKPLERA
ncbi:MAG: hypothetical protein NTY01_15410 [Verrucomicrobia bacterium]|nr:hypothetical protein [Verrucomicrobiota bacterium]